MVAKKHKIMSLSVEPQMHELLRSSAKKMNMGVSQLIRELVDEHLDLIVNDGEEIPVILRIPADLVEDKKGLRSWLTLKVDGLVDHFTK